MWYGSCFHYTVGAALHIPRVGHYSFGFVSDNDKDNDNDNYDNVVQVLRLHIPPPGVSLRVGHCVCGVASDHSVTLLSLKVGDFLCTLQ